MVAVGAWRGVGGTTAALALAAAFATTDPETLLVEADPAGGVLAGRMAVPPEAVGGLEAAAFPVIGSALTLDDVAFTSGTMRVVTAPADPFRADACHRPREPWVTRLASRSGTAVVDVGRLRGGSPVRSVLECADVLVVVLTPEVGGAVGTVEWVRAAGRVSPADGELAGTEIRLLVVDAPCGVSFPRRTVESELGDLLVGWLPWEPPAVDLLQRGAPLDDRRLRRSAFAVEATRVAGVLRGVGR